MITEELLAAFEEGKTNAEETALVLEYLATDESLQEEFILSQQLDAMMGADDEETDFLPMAQMAAKSEGNLCDFQCEQFILKRRKIEYNSDELSEEARNNSWLRERGTPLHSVGRLLEQRGLIVMRSYGSSIDSVIRALKAGHDAIVVVNSCRLPENSEEEIAYHAAVVLDVNEEEVTLYDPATGEESTAYPKDHFIAAWNDAKAYLENAEYPIVLKADGLALGKGVLICPTKEEALAGVDELMLDKKFGSAGNTIVIEEFMTGREVSVLSFVDGNTIKIMSSAQDHKRAKDGDQGLNTGGMGTFSPSPFYTEEVDAFCKKYIYQATVDAMAAEGRPFKGVIFFGLMLTPNGPKVLEYNARFGDPEAQVVLPRMKNDIIEVMEACVDGTLDQIDLQFEDNAAVCVVLASDGYPVSYEKGYVINGLEKFNGKEGYYCFHAGTKLTDKGIVTNGGRVLGVTAKGATLKEARANAYEATEWITFENKYMRHDIGKAIDEA